MKELLQKLWNSFLETMFPDEQTEGMWRVQYALKNTKHFAVLATWRPKGSNHIYWGISKCAKADKFDKKKGTALARSRATWAALGGHETDSSMCGSIFVYPGVRADLIKIFRSRVGLK